MLFYSFHTTIVPVCLVLLSAFHFWRVRKARGVVHPPNNEPKADEMVTTMPHLLLRELAVGLTLIAALVVFSTFVNAPLDAPANPGMSPNPAKAPWYFLGFQELQIHFAPLFSVLIIPLAVFGGLILLPYLRYEPELSGPWLLSAAGRRSGLTAIATGTVVTSALVVVAEIVNANGVGWFSFFVVCAGITGFAAIVRKIMHTNMAETVQSTVLLVFTIFAVLTATGIWFRGPGMALTWPWGL